MGPLHCFAMSAIVAKLSFSPYLPNSPHSPTFMAPSLLCALPCRRLLQNCHFRHICQIRHIRQLLWPPHCFVLCHVGDCCKIVIFATFANSPHSPTFMGPLHCFVFCLVGDCGKIVIFAIFAKFAAFANFYGPLHCFVFCLVGACGKIVIVAIFAKFAYIFSFLPFLLLCTFLDISPPQTSFGVRLYFSSITATKAQVCREFSTL